MRTYLEAIRIDVENLFKILKRLKKYPGNVAYKEKERQVKLELDKDFKRLVGFVKEGYGKRFKKELKILEGEIEILLGNSNVKNRIGKIDAFLRKLNELEIAAERIAPPLGLKFPFPSNLVSKLGNKFTIDIKDLRLVWNKSGNCTAFLLRRIIEKAIYFAFAKQGMIDKLKEGLNTSKFVGLNKMIDIATKEKAKDGTPFLTQKTAEHLKRSKFLGDAAAHNFLADIYLEQIQTEINYIITALDELSKKL